MMKNSKSRPKKEKKTSNPCIRAKNKVQLTAYIDRNLKEKFKKVAESEEMTMTDYLIHLINEKVS
jgi:hypothetical protein